MTTTRIEHAGTFRNATKNSPAFGAVFILLRADPGFRTAALPTPTTRTPAAATHRLLELGELFLVQDRLHRREQFLPAFLRRGTHRLAVRRALAPAVGAARGPGAELRSTAGRRELLDRVQPRLLLGGIELERREDVGQVVPLAAEKPE